MSNSPTRMIPDIEELRRQGRQESDRLDKNAQISERDTERLSRREEDNREKQYRHIERDVNKTSDQLQKDLDNLEKDIVKEETALEQSFNEKLSILQTRFDEEYGKELLRLELKKTDEYKLIEDKRLKRHQEIEDRYTPKDDGDWKSAEQQEAEEWEFNIDDVVKGEPYEQDWTVNPNIDNTANIEKEKLEADREAELERKRVDAILKLDSEDINKAYDQSFKKAKVDLRTQYDQALEELHEKIFGRYQKISKNPKEDISAGVEEYLENIYAEQASKMKDAMQSSLNQASEENTRGLFNKLHDEEIQEAHGNRIEQTLDNEELKRSEFYKQRGPFEKAYDAATSGTSTDDLENARKAKQEAERIKAEAAARKTQGNQAKKGKGWFSTLRDNVVDKVVGGSSGRVMSWEDHVEDPEQYS